MMELGAADWGEQPAGLSPRLPMVSGDEVAELANRYGTPIYRSYDVQADEYIYSYRWQRDSDRRAEVVFAICDRLGRYWVHSKRTYPAHIFRLPSGGIHWDERVDCALLREVAEETGLPVKVECFVGLVEYRFWRQQSSVAFASYVFALRSLVDARPEAHGGEPISDFRAVLPSQIAQIAVDLRNLIGDRRGWGQWRALVHDLIFDYLSS
jgi:ADP-ribose pyrophosphatase YjhB (NUDIX family)